jgi:hypothetical protein
MEMKTMSMNKMMATLAVGGMIAGLAACGGSQPEPATGATPGTEAQGAGEHKCSSDGKCGGEKKEAPPADGAATPAPAADPAAAPK